MKIDLRGGSPREDGFGVAGRTIRDTLIELGHEIEPDAEISLLFTHPEHFIAEAEYNIGYFPWESTEPQPGWKRKMRRMDEIWVTSPLMVDYVKEWGFDPYVYQHGVNPDWKPRKRGVDSKLTFIHQGLEAYRKGGHETLMAFNAAFADKDDVRLVMKTAIQNIVIDTGKVSTENRIIPKEDLLNLYYNAHVMVAPSYGEGFGLPAFDAMGSGMPTIMTKDVFPHEEFADHMLLIDSTVVDSPWPKIHPGKMWKPSVDDLVDIMRYTYDNYETIADIAYHNAHVIHEEASWEKRTKKAMNDLVMRIQR